MSSYHDLIQQLMLNALFIGSWRVEGRADVASSSYWLVYLTSVTQMLALDICEVNCITSQLLHKLFINQY